MDIPKGLPKEMQDDLRELQELDSKARLEPPPAPSEVGDFWSEQQLERMRWVVPALSAAGGGMVAGIFGFNYPFTVVSCLALVWSAASIASVPLWGPECIEIDRRAQTVTIKRKRRFRPSMRVWHFAEIAGFTMRSRTGRPPRHLDPDNNSRRVTSYWIGMRLLDGRSVDLFRRNYYATYDFVQMSKRHDILELMTGTARPQRTSFT